MKNQRALNHCLVGKRWIIWLFWKEKIKFSRFAVGVYNPDTEKVIVNEAPVYHFKQTVKALKNATSESNLAERIVHLHFLLIYKNV